MAIVPAPRARSAEQRRVPRVFVHEQPTTPSASVGTAEVVGPVTWQSYGWSLGCSFYQLKGFKKLALSVALLLAPMWTTVLPPVFVLIICRFLTKLLAGLFACPI
jgi:hypothetical protein